MTTVPTRPPDGGSKTPALPLRPRRLLRRQDPNPEKYMTIMEHIAELRQRLMISAGAVLVTTIVSLLFTTQLLQYLVQPVRNSVVDAHIVYTEPMGFIGPYFRVALIAGISLAMPIIVYEILAFVTPGLTPQEKRWVLPIVFGASILFVLGCAFAFYIELPPALRFLLGFSPGDIQPFITIKSYIDFVTRLMLVTGLVFELPIIVMALAKLRIVRSKKLLGWWRFAIVIAFIAAAIVTPSIDPLTQSLVAGPMIILYFLGIILARLVEPKEEAPAQAPAAVR
jgi:sec-independent protein translocase protein TatC